LRRRSLYILVEGDDDELFFEKVLKKCFNKKYDEVYIIQWRQKSKERLNNYLDNLETEEYPYIFVADFRRICISQTKDDLTQTYETLGPAHIAVVRKEIESWCIAGLDRSACERLGIPETHRTEGLGKRRFDSMMPKRYKTVAEFMMDIFREYSIDVARTKNDSIAHLLDTYGVCGV
jgi:hypothetical protein